MDGKTKIPYAIPVQYMDEKPFELKRDLIIYTENPNSIFFIEFDCIGEWESHRIKGHIKPSSMTLYPTNGDPGRVKKIEDSLRKDCKSKGKNLIKINDMRNLVQVMKRHLYMFYGVGQYFNE